MLKLFQSPSKIVNQLKNNQITDKDHYYFLIGIVLLNSMIPQSSLLEVFTYFSSNPFYGSLSVFTFIIWGWEIHTCFHINQQGDRQHFLSRYMCLSFAVSIRYYAIYYLMSWLLSLMLNAVLFMRLDILEQIQALLAVAIGLMSPIYAYVIFLKMKSLFRLVADNDRLERA